MKFATLRTGEVVAQTNEGYRRVNRSSMIELIETFRSGLTFSGAPMELPDKLAPPIAKPSKSGPQRAIMIASTPRTRTTKVGAAKRPI